MQQQAAVHSTENRCLLSKDNVGDFAGQCTTYGTSAQRHMHQYVNAVHPQKTVACVQDQLRLFARQQGIKWSFVLKLGVGVKGTLFRVTNKNPKATRKKMFPILFFIFQWACYIL